jgi:hypothetical protein
MLSKYARWIFCLFYFYCLTLHAIETDKKKYNLVICAVFQDESFFMKEWIEYHRLLGVEHFYLYNNLSTDHYQEILAPYIAEGLVDLYDWNVPTGNSQEYMENLQKPVYIQACHQLRETASWIAFIDLDEFIVPTQANDLRDFLKDYEEYAGLTINWQMFGTSGVYSLASDELVSEKFLWKAPSEKYMNQFIKLIVKPEWVVGIHDPHHFQFAEGKFAVNSDKVPLPKDQRGQEVIIDKIRLNHYWFGSLEWFLNHKIPRREKWGVSFPMDQLEYMLDSYNRVYDDAILRFVPVLKQQMSASL